MNIRNTSFIPSGYTHYRITTGMQNGQNGVFVFSAKDVYVAGPAEEALKSAENI